METPTPYGITENQMGTREKETIRRLGKFRISWPLIEHWRQLLPLMGRLVIVRAESVFYHSAIEYTAFCADFDDCPEGMEPPMYKIEARRDGDTHTFEIVKGDA